jgi:hypothetical protein
LAKEFKYIYGMGGQAEIQKMTGRRHRPMDQHLDRHILAYIWCISMPISLEKNRYLVGKQASKIQNDLPPALAIGPAVAGQSFTLTVGCLAVSIYVLIALYFIRRFNYS